MSDSDDDVPLAKRVPVVKKGPTVKTGNSKSKDKTVVLLLRVE